MQIIQFDNTSRKAWKERCLKNSKGKLLPVYGNAVLALQNDHDVRDVFAFDEMLRAEVMTHEIGQITTCARWVTEKDTNDLLGWFQTQGGMPGMNINTVRQALHTRARECAFHPVVDYLTSLQWDGVPRLGTWLAMYLGAEINPYNEHIGRMFLTSMVARVIMPGCQADHMAVLEGPQGILKSSACRVLGGKWFSDGMPDITNGREASQHLRDKWLVEVSEMHAMNRAEAALLKSFISRTVERYRPYYGHQEVKEPRQCVFVGTTNMEMYLKDPTGGRRFWPIRAGVSGRINLDQLSYNRDQLFAEALDNFNSGELWWPDAAFESELIKPEQAERYQGDIWEDQIEEYVALKERVTILEIARDKLGFVNKEMRMEHALRIASILRDLGWELKRQGRVRFWKRADKKRH